MTGSCKAICQIASSSNNNVLGYLHLTQTSDTPGVSITGTLSGLTPGKHGLTVNAAGDLSNGAKSCGAIFNPFGEWARTNERKKQGKIEGKPLVVCRSTWLDTCVSLELIVCVSPFPLASFTKHIHAKTQINNTATRRMRITWWETWETLPWMNRVRSK